MEQRKAILIRCCANDFQEALRLFRSLPPLGAPVYLVYVGESLPAEVPPALGDRIIFLNVDFLKRAGLYTPRLDFDALTWQCGDLVFYAADERVKADYYWMIEPDVYASSNVLAKLFAAPLRANFYAPRLRREHEQWYWYRGTRKYFSDVWACLFCLVAVRRDVLPALRQRRSELLAAWSSTDETYDQMPNDEGFVCSFFQERGEVCADLNTLGRFYTHHSMRFGMPASRRTIGLSRDSRYLVHHPVCTGASFEQKFQQRLSDFGLSYRPAYELLVERRILPIAPVVDQITVAGYLVFAEPRATWRYALYNDESSLAKVYSVARYQSRRVKSGIGRRLRRALRARPAVRIKRRRKKVAPS